MRGRSRHGHVWNNDSRHREAAPATPEDRSRPESTYAGPTTAAGMAAQLAEDPEFREWVAEERMAAWFGPMGRAPRG